MRDLKHLIYFENLLENADNELVKQAQADGKLAVGYTCYHVPEALLNVGNCFPCACGRPGPALWTSPPITCPTIPASSPVPWWSGAWRAASSSWTLWPVWTPVP